MSRPTGFWQVLEAIPGAAAVDAEWKTRFGPDYEAVKAFLRPNGKLASSYPCTVPRGCGCEHDVIIHGPEDIVAVCRCGRGCETFPLRRSDIVIYEVDRSALDMALVDALGLFKETETRIDLHGTTRIGIYSPYAGFRFPVYLTVQLEPDDFADVADGLLGRNDIPFTLLAPTRGLSSPQVEKRLTDRRATFVPLSENVAFGDKGQLRLLHPIDGILAQFCATNLPAEKDDGSMIFFPTPPDAVWSDVSIRFKDSHTVSIKVKAARRVVHYAQMGMADKKSSKPTKQWELLETFANELGVLDWRSKKADRRNQKRRELLAADLRAFFRIEGDPFFKTKDKKGWQAHFLISPD